jgi:endoglucanase
MPDLVKIAHNLNKTLTCMKTIFRFCQSINIRLTLFIVSFMATCTVAQTQVVEVVSISNKVLTVHFNEGSVNYHKVGQAQFCTDQVVFTNAALNVGAATTLGTYSISSTNDANYTTAKNPSLINRKSKPTSLAICDVAPTHTKEHWIYLSLPTTLQSGKSYTLTIGGGVATQSSFTFTFDEKTIASDAIHINNLGFVPDAPSKYAYLYSWIGDGGSADLSAFNGQPFQVVNSTNNAVVFTGTIAFRKAKTNQEASFGGPFVGETPNDNFSGADVWECDFSAYKGVGTFKIVVPGMGCSSVFSMNNDVYRNAYIFTMKGLLQNRSGIDLTPANSGERDRPAPHNPNITPGFANRLKFTTDPNKHGCTGGVPTSLGNINTWGWYQDAGDYDAYPSHAFVPLSLMFLYEAAPKNFTDSELENPERNNQIPDVIDEGAWLVRYYQRTRKAIKDAGYGTGGVGGGNAAGDDCSTGGDLDGIGRGSWKDVNRDWYISGEEVNLTFLYSGMAAQMAFILQSIGVADPGGINWQQEAIETWNWATAKGGSNTKSRMYAAASLYRLTGDAKYHSQFKIDFNANVKTTTLFYLDTEAIISLRWGSWMYLNTQKLRPVDAGIISTIKSAIFNTANQLVTSADKRACRWGGDFGFPMLIGQATTPQVEDLVYAVVAANSANDLTTANSYKKYIYTTADYFLGTNPLKTTWITGLGPKAVKQLFHLDSWYSGDGSPKRGYIPYGPWSRFDKFPNPSPFSSDWPYQYVYPTDIAQWPGHERWFDQRASPLSAEFTVNQTNAIGAMVYGFLTEGKFSPAVPVTGISLAPKPLTFTTEGQTQQLTATITPANASNKGVFWVSRNNDVATVDAMGKVTALVQGQTYIVARTFDSNKLDSVLVNANLPFVAVTSVSITGTVTTVNKNRTLQLTGTVLPANATNKNINWTSSNNGIATVDVLGTVTGLAAGAVTITATTVSGSKVATYAVTVLDPADYIIADYETFIPTINVVVAGKVQQFSPNATSSIIPNPVKTTDNNTNNVTQYDRPAGAYSLLGFQLPTPLNIADGYRRLTFQIYGPNVPQIYVQINDASNTLIKDEQVLISFNNSWATVNVDLPATGIIQGVNIFPNPNGTTPTVYYIDNVKITATAPVTDTQAPTQPTNLTVSNITTSSFTVNWTASTDNVGVVSYDIFRDGNLAGNSTTTSFNLTGLASSTAYSMSVKAKDAAGNSSAASTALSVTTGSPQGTGTGLRALYYNNKTLSGSPVVSRIDTAVAYNWGSASPGAGINADNFSARWVGQVEAPVSGIYKFSTNSDDGVRLWVNNVKVIENWTDHGPTINETANITLVAGQKYDIRMEYYENAGGAVAALRWTYPGRTVVNIPKSRLYNNTVGTGLNANYFNNKDLTGTPVVNRTDATVNYNWGTASPVPGTVNVDNFSVRWLGKVKAYYSETYTFYTNSDDGVRLFVNGVQVINNFTDHSVIENSGTIALVAGQTYDIKMEYYESGGDAVAQLSWSSVSQPKQIIPTENLYLVGSPGARLGEELSAENTENEIRLYPNPTSGSINLEFYSNTEQSVSILMYNMMGTEINKMERQAVQGINKINIPLGSSVKQGMYLMQVWKDGEQKTAKFIVE